MIMTKLANEKSRYENQVYVPMTYEQAKEEFDALCTQDPFSLSVSVTPL